MCKFLTSGQDCVRSTTGQLREDRFLRRERRTVLCRCWRCDRVGPRVRRGRTRRRLYDRDRRHGGFVPGMPVTRLTITTNNTRHLSHPPSQHTRQPSTSSPSSTAWKSRRNFVSICIVRSGHAWLGKADKSTPESMGLINPKSPKSPFSSSRCKPKGYEFESCLERLTGQ